METPKRMLLKAVKMRKRKARFEESDGSDSSDQSPRASISPKQNCANLLLHLTRNTCPETPLRRFRGSFEEDTPPGSPDLDNIVPTPSKSIEKVLKEAKRQSRLARQNRRKRMRTGSYNIFSSPTLLGHNDSVDDEGYEAIDLLKQKLDEITSRAAATKRMSDFNKNLFNSENETESTTEACSNLLDDSVNDALLFECTEIVERNTQAVMDVSKPSAGAFNAKELLDEDDECFLSVDIGDY